MFDNIVAISSGNINQPISIIRMSGPNVFDIIQKVFRGKVGLDKTITLGQIVDSDNHTIDQVLVSWFYGPNTFTGQNIVEINAHGGVVNTQQILKLLLVNGARLAEPGEFSRRAFLNGKIDLVKAEAIHDLIFAKTPEQARLASKKFDLQTSKLIDSLISEVLYLIATIETNIDYPEYDDVEQITTEVLIPKLRSISNKLKDIINSSNASRAIYEGVKVAIVGRPNVGKSSLLNAILNQDKALVSSKAGTTRDVVEGQVQINQVLFSFSDTAGMHETDDDIEKQGITKALEEIQKANLIIHVLDAQNELNEEDLKIIEATKNKKYLQVWNKNDIKKIDGLSISAKNKDINSLIKAIENIYQNIDIDNEQIINNSRQLALIEQSYLLASEALSGLENNLDPSVVIVDIQKIWENLSNVLGKANQEDLLDMIFKSFCLGK